MVKLLTEKPDAFKHAQEGDVYYRLFDDAGSYAFGCINFSYPPIAMMHLEVHRFSHNIMKSADADWQYILTECQKRSCNIIHINTEGTIEEQSTFIKFVGNFGFKKFTQYIASIQHI